MKHFAAQYIITNSGPPLKRAVVSAEDDGTIISIEDTGGELSEKHSTEFYNGIIIPGFVNCHCHLELSHMKSQIPKETGLGAFIGQIRNTRNDDKDTITTSAFNADKDMLKEGIVLCADVCNTSGSFKIKKESSLSYINLLEVFGLDPDKAEKRINDIMKVAETANEMRLPYSLVPHSAYSMSLSLFSLLKNKSLNNKVTSIHFMESAGEEAFLKNQTGTLMSSYRKAGLLPSRLEIARCHADVINNEITGSGNLILVHNLYTDKDTIGSVKGRENLYWCLCPDSNLYIENKLPPVNMLLENGCTIVIGTDSLASNSNLSILEELKTLQLHFPGLSIEELILWATLNGAKALNEEERFGKIEKGKKPGLLLLQDIDLQNMKLLPESSVSRLI